MCSDLQYLFTLTNYAYFCCELLFNVDIFSRVDHDTSEEIIVGEERWEDVLELSQEAGETVDHTQVNIIHHYLLKYR